MAAPKYLEYDSSSGDIKQITSVETGPAVEQIVATDAGGTLDISLLPADAITSVVGITIDGGGSAPSTGVKGSIQVHVPGTIIGWFVVADVSGSLTIEVDKHASSAPPAAPAIPNTSTDKISASAPISLSSAQSASGDASAVSTWTTAVAAWDVFQFNLTAASTLTRVTVGVVILRS